MEVKSKTRSILFIDDSRLVLQTVRHLLQNSPYDLLTAGNPFDGLCTLVQSRPACVFIDANTMRLDGFQFCQLVRAQPLYQLTRLFLVLDAADAIEQAKAVAAGAEAVLVKPFGQAELHGLLAAREEQAA